jgi:DNA-binding transcriptional regulator YhcF (GntR family)
VKLVVLVHELAQTTQHNAKTVRAALDNLEIEGKVEVYRMPKSAIKMVKMKEEVKLYAI